SLWSEERDPPAGDPDALTVLPHRAMPAGTPDEVAAAFDTELADFDGPSAAVISTETASDRGTDAYVLSDAPGVVGHARAFVDSIVRVKEAIPADSALYLSGV